VTSDSPELPPTDSVSLAAWFAEAVRAEIAVLERKRQGQTYELLAGRLLGTISRTEGVFRFTMADPSRIPDESAGLLKTGANEYPASVDEQHDNVIVLRLQGESLPANIPRALLTIDDTDLLRRLAEALQEIVERRAAVHPLAVTVFHPAQAAIGLANVTELALKASSGKIEPEQEQAIQQALGSSLTFIWGPPGTGKTHVIAHLAEQLLEAGERVLVTSHTHAAVNEALVQTLRLANESETLRTAEQDGAILRIGRTEDKRVPDSVRLETIVEAEAADIQAEIAQLEEEARPLAERSAACTADMEKWDRLDKLRGDVQAVRSAVAQAEAHLASAKAALSSAREVIRNYCSEVERAQHAWLWRAARTAKALRRLQEAEAELGDVQGTHDRAFGERQHARDLAARTEAALAQQEIVCRALRPCARLQEELSALAASLDPLHDRIRELEDTMSQLEHDVIERARVIFCTLTKLYTGSQLKDQWFHAVIADEISMALPPLLFLAAGRAATRVVLVGDFLQLPPIIRSDLPISNARLRTDAFHLSGLVDDNGPTKNATRVMPHLTKQRRMVTPIADVARHLVYNQAGLTLTEHKSVFTREPPDWLDFLPEDPLLILDTADLHCWTGKQPGTLSRFNFYSARLAVELAAMAAANASPPSDEKRKPIGIVTPYAAQRRLIASLVTDMHLEPWVLPGTVHTFQGGEADLVIFDCVLDEPYWSARLSTPDDRREVLRDLNVAVTRAKHKFVFIGSSEWLNLHASPRSALGELWEYLKRNAPLESATDVVELGFRQRVSADTLDPHGWRLPYEDDEPIHEILDENNFFERFALDVSFASQSIFALAAYFGDYRWPKVQPLIVAALERGVDVTLVTPPPEDSPNPQYVNAVIDNLRSLGAVVVASTGMHGKDIVIDERVVYTGSMNWSSHRGRQEQMHRADNPRLARMTLDFMQAKYIRLSSVYEDGTPRTCPAGHPTHVVNQAAPLGPWDRRQALKIACAHHKTTGCKYLRDIDERPPFKRIPRCPQDGRTKYRRVRRGRSEVWQCPKHPKECDTFKVLPGDPE